jgi:hypothetical protein
MKDKMEEALKKFLNGKFTYDNMGQYIWLVEPDGNHQKIADLRGYGAIQNLFKNSKGHVDIDKANAFQDFLGEWLVKSLNSESENTKLLEEIKTIVYNAEDSSHLKLIIENVIYK